MTADTFCIRYNEVAKKAPLSGVDETLVRDFAHYQDLLISSADSIESWYQLSSKSYYKYLEIEGSQSLHWKNKGFAVLFDVLQVKLTSDILYLYVIIYLKYDSQICTYASINNNI